MESASSKSFHAGHETVRFAIEDLQISRIAVGNVNAVQILPIEHGVRLANAIYLVNQFACLQIKHNDSMVAFRSRKQPPAFRSIPKWSKFPLTSAGSSKSLDQLDWCSHLTPAWIPKTMRVATRTKDRFSIFSP